MASKNQYIIEVTTKGTEKAKKSLGGVDKSLASMGKKALKIGAIALALKKIGESAVALVKLSGRAEGLRTSFDSLSQATGLSKNALDTLTKATDGTVDSIKLMEQANKAMTLGIVNSEDQMGNMFDIAQRLGKAMGLDVTQALDSLTTGLGRQSVLMLDNLGIMVDTKTAYINYAESIGKAVSELTEQEKKTAFINEAMAQAQSKADALGEETLDASDAFNQLTTSFTEFGIILGKIISPYIVPLVKFTAELAKQATEVAESFTEEEKAMTSAEKHTWKLTQANEKARKEYEANLEVVRELNAKRFNQRQSEEALQAIMNVTKKVLGELKKEYDETSLALDVWTQALESAFPAMEEMALRTDDITDNIKKIPVGEMTIMYTELEESMMRTQEVMNNFWASHGENINLGMQQFSAMTSAMSEELNSRFQNELSNLKDSDKYRQADNEKRADMEKDLNKKFAKERLRIWKMEKASKLSQAFISVSGAVAEALKTLNPVFVAMIASMGAVQIGAILKTKPPKFAQGGVIGGQRHSAGGTMIEAEQGEFVMNRNAVNRIGVNALNSMNQGGGGININISAPLVDDTIVDTIIPKIKEAVRRGADIGVS